MGRGVCGREAVLLRWQRQSSTLWYHHPSAVTLLLLLRFHEHRNTSYFYIISAIPVWRVEGGRARVPSHVCDWYRNVVQPEISFELPQSRSTMKLLCTAAARDFVAPRAEHRNSQTLFSVWRNSYNPPLLWLWATNKKVKEAYCSMYFL